MTTWIAVACVGLGSYALRLLPMLVGGRVRWPGPVDRAIDHAGLAALTALVIAGIQHHDGGGRPGAMLWAITAVIVARCRGWWPPVWAVTGCRACWSRASTEPASCHRLAGDS
jgi:branched-subunit amino acid transport protein